MCGRQHHGREPSVRVTRRSWAMCIAGVLSVPELSCQLFQQRLRLLEIGGVKPLGEPTVDWRQQRVGLGALALLLPQAAQTRGGAQLPRFGLLATGHIEGVTKVNSGGATGAGTPSDEPS